MSLLLVAIATTVAHAGGTETGRVAPDFTLPDGDARPVSLAGLRGSIVVLDFWATWCGACEKALPALDALAARHRADGVIVLALDVDRARDQATRFLAERLPSPALTVLYDPDAEVLARYGAEGMPALFVIDREGIVRAAEAGYTPERLAIVERTVAELAARERSAARPPPPDRSAP